MRWGSEELAAFLTKPSGTRQGPELDLGSSFLK
jgi:hypothetical protein